MRIVLTVPEDMLKEACRRIAQFCEHHVFLENILKNLKVLDCENVNVIGIK